MRKDVATRVVVGWGCTSNETKVYLILYFNLFSYSCVKERVKACLIISTAFSEPLFDSGENAAE